MASSILPNDKSSFLPDSPTDGQVFVDSEFVKWIYDSYNKVWNKKGVVESIPLADINNNGLLSPQDKGLLDSVPTVPGGFGIITDTKLLLQSTNNPDGVITGDIKLKSDSLDITCVSGDNIKLNCNNSQIICDDPNATNPPGLLFKLNNKFLDTLYVDLSGPKGKTGYRGPKGKQGQHGFSGGPEGDKGKKGKNVNELCEFSGVMYKDEDGLTDTSIVDLKITDDEHGSKLVSTKAKLNLDLSRAADKIQATSIGRSLSFSVDDEDSETCKISRLDNWNLTQAAGDTTPLNMQLLRLAKDNNSGESIEFNGTMSLSDFVEDIIDEYKNKLDKLDKQWGKETKMHIEAIDDKARTILSGLANDLAMCEFNLPAIEYCITWVGCGTGTKPSTF